MKNPIIGLLGLIWDWTYGLENKKQIDTSTSSLIFRDYDHRDHHQVYVERRESALVTATLYALDMAEESPDESEAVKYWRRNTVPLMSYHARRERGLRIQRRLNPRKRKNVQYDYNPMNVVDFNFNPRHLMNNG